MLCEGAFVLLTSSFFCVQVQLVQQVVDGVNLLVEMEKKLEKGESIDSLMPKKK